MFGLTASSALTGTALGAVFALIAWYLAPKLRDVGSAKAARQPSDSQLAQGFNDELGALKKVLALELQVEQLAQLLKDHKEGTERRFGRLYQQGRRDAAAADDDQPADDPRQLELLPKGAPSAPAPNGRRRFLVPRA